VTIEWTPAAVASARRYMHDQDGMRIVGAAISALADDPCPPSPDGFHRGRYHRLRAGLYRIVYMVDDDVVTIDRVDRLGTGTPPSESHQSN
jgi:mRNA-degrading endonuclease RelE of RelBE toxin-antitoxin system